VSGAYKPRGKVAEFVAHNRELISDIEKVEIKTRRRNLLVNDQLIYDFYAERLPADTCSRSSLEAWLARDNQNVLKLNRRQLLVNEIDADEVAQFPDQIEVAGKTIAIRYKFDPGTPRDGVTMVVPISVLAPFPEYIGDWLVPGLLREKCIALIKTLPKPIRRNFAPAVDAVDRVLSKLKLDNVPLHQSLADALYHTHGVQVTGEDFAPGKLDTYYQMSYRVIDVDNSLIDEDKDLQALKQRYAGARTNKTRKTQYHNLEFWRPAELRRVPTSRNDSPRLPHATTTNRWKHRPTDP